MKLKVFSVLLPYVFNSLQSSRILNVFGRFEELFEIWNLLKFVQINLDVLNLSEIVLTSSR